MSSWSTEVSQRIVTKQILSKKINTTSTIVKNIDQSIIDQEQCRRINVSKIILLKSSGGLFYETYLGSLRVHEFLVFL